MNAISQSNFLLALGWAVLNSLWQMALLWVLYQLITGIFKKLNPSQKSAIATALLFTGFTWFCFSFISLMTGTHLSEAVAYQGVININDNPELDSWLQKTLPLASVAYIILLVLPVLNFLRNYRYVQTIRRYGLSRADVQARLFVQKMAGQMGIKKPVYLWLSELVTSPVTIGYLRPVILLPLAAVNQLTTQQLEAVLLHELSHIRRYDYFLNLVIKFIHSVLYFNPFVKAFIKNIEREREKSCDDIVMQFQYEPHGYASALLELEKANHFPQTLAVAASGKKNDLLHRVEWIMGIRSKKTISFNRVAGVLAALLCFIALNALLILSKKTDNNRNTDLFADISSPLHFFDEGEHARSAVPLLSSSTEHDAATIVNHAKSADEKKCTKKAEENEERYPAYTDKMIVPPPTPQAPAAASPFSFASFLGNVTPLLDAYKEAQITVALEGAKKVMTEGQWKELEKTIADVMTTAEKEELKAAYTEEINKIDLSKVNNSLHQSFNEIDWSGITVELNNALAEIKIDSTQKVYKLAIANMSELQKEMKENKITGIPDSDITLKSLEEKKKETISTVNKLRSIRNKKIISL
jgi:beta-lactamase regulating signal transducer with metallopeptidase domain